MTTSMFMIGFLLKPVKFNKTSSVSATLVTNSKIRPPPNPAYNLLKYVE